jgi:hypothetical protein
MKKVIAKWFRTSSLTRRPRATISARRLSGFVEELEGRLLLHGDEFVPRDDDILPSAIDLRNGRLILHGDQHANAIDVSLSDTGDEIECRVDNIGPQSFPVADVQSIHIRSGGGDDHIAVDVALPTFIRAGRGDDEITGGEGDDRIRAGRGLDVIDAEDGDDTCMGGKGDDMVMGGDGDDHLYGGWRHSGDSDEHRRDGRDTLLGGDGDDLLSGGTQADMMDGEEGADSLKGGRGRDTFAPDDGEDTHRDFKQGHDVEADVPGGEPDVNNAPTANPQTVNVVMDTARTITLTGDDGDPGVTQTLSFRIQALPLHGTLRDSNSALVTVGTTLPSASVTYTPNAGFTGNDLFTFNVMDNGGTADGGQDTSTAATVSITITQAPIQPFAPVTTGEFTDANLLGTRTDLVTGAPDVTDAHHDNTLTDSFYVQNGYSNPPTYGPHHFHAANDPTVGHTNPAPVVPTGVMTTELPDVDLVHNLEHGHVWISYNPTLLSASDLAALQQLIRDGVGNADGSGAGIILTPRSANTTAIVMASWAHLQTLNSFDATAVRNFIETNRGHAPEGFITP